MPRFKFTEKGVKALKAPAAGRVEYFDLALPGFGIRLSSTGAASWFVFYRIDGKQVRDIIGRRPGKDLAEARQEAKDKLALVERNRDPRTEEARQKAQEARQRAETFGKLATDYKTEHLRKLRSGDDLWSAIEADFLPDWNDLPIRDLTRHVVKTKLNEIEADRGPYARNRRLSLIRHMLNFALDEELVDANVSARIKMLQETRRDRILTDAELVEVWNAAGRLMAPYNALVRQLILSGQRRNEVSETAWSEIDEANALWMVPAARMKSKLGHEIPLTAAMLTLIRGVPTANDRKTYVYSSLYRKDAPVRSMAQMKENLDRFIFEARRQADPQAEPMAPWRLHDLRRTMRSGLSKLRVPTEIAERVIGHMPAGIQRVYDRHAYRDEKRQALEQWSAYVMALVDPSPNVTPIEQARQRRGTP